MSTYKKTGPHGCDYAVPGPNPVPCGPAPHPEYCYVYPDVEPVPTPPIPGKPPIPPCPPPPYPFPDKIDAASKKIAKLSQKSKVLVSMIKAWHKGKPAILTIGKDSYQFGTETMMTSDGTADGMYSKVICAAESPDLEEGTDYTIEDDGTVVLNEGIAKDLLQTELKRVQIEIAQVANLLSDEVDDNGISPAHAVIGVD